MHVLIPLNGLWLMNINKNTQEQNPKQMVFWDQRPKAFSKLVPVVLIFGKHYASE